MFNGIEYRTATTADAPVIFDLVCELAEYEKLRHEVTSTAQDFAKLLSDKTRFFCFIAEKECAAVGFCMGFYTLSTFLGKPGLYIEDVYVKETCRGHGIGKHFFQMVCQKAMDEDCGRVEWSVLDWNEPSIKFYDSLGGVPQSEWIKYRLSGGGIPAVAGA
jgi:GNAT superfamily N-acetyltransferase